MLVYFQKLMALICLLLTAVSSQALAKESLVKYEFDKTHSFVIWRVSHFGFSDVTGKFLADGSVLYDSKNPENSKVNVTIAINSVTTAIKKLDDKLLSKAYFDQAQYPQATFISDSITRTGETTGRIKGQLTVRGITKPIVLDVRMTKQANHPMFNRHTMGFVGKAMIKRSDFGLRAYVPAVSDEVQLEIQAEAIQVKAETKQ